MSLGQVRTRRFICLFAMILLWTTLLPINILGDGGPDPNPGCGNSLGCSIDCHGKEIDGCNFQCDTQRPDCDNCKCDDGDPGEGVLCNCMPEKVPPP